MPIGPTSPSWCFQQVLLGSSFPISLGPKRLRETSSSNPVTAVSSQVERRVAVTRRSLISTRSASVNGCGVLEAPKKTKRNDRYVESTDMCEGLCIYIVIPVHICAGRMCIYSK